MLVDGDHAQPARFDRREPRHGVSVEDDGAAVGRRGAGEDADQRGLAGTVFAHQRVDLARTHVERGVGERADPGVGLGEVGDEQHQVATIDEGTGRQVMDHTNAGEDCAA